jgi:hypothetical protein
MEKETLEEANWKVLGTKNDTFYIGAKWMQERMYSEEDLQTAFFAGLRKAHSSKKHSVCWEEWFEQHKKK